MSNNPKVVAFVHAKGHSERLPGKNLRVLGDRPLVCHAIANALACQIVDRVVIDSDDDEILHVGEQAGAEPWKRPKGLASNEATGDGLAAWQALIYPESSVLVQVVPTCPFTLSESIQSAVRAVMRGGYDSAVGVRKAPLYTWRADPADKVTGAISSGVCKYRINDRIPNSQDVTPTIWETTGLYAVSMAYVKETYRRVSSAPYFVYQTLIEAIDINGPDDFWLAEQVWKGLHA